MILASFHGMPKDYLRQGRPLSLPVRQDRPPAARAARLAAERFRMTFQSRFGPDEWLQPYTDETVGAGAGRAPRSLAIIAPGFSADCLETLEEIDGENREIFLHHGGENFAYLPCLNDSRAKAWT